MSADRIALAGRVHAEMLDLERVVARATRMWTKARERGDEDYLDGVALNLHGFYAGAEHIFREIAHDVDGAVPAGPEWHRELLIQMAAELPSLRPPVITRATRDCLDEYRNFRHVVRNVYTFNLRPSRLAELVGGLRACYETLSHDIADFAEFLESQDAE
jgi:hypothetical protein